MECPKCGAYNDANAYQCADCGAPLSGATSSDDREAPEAIDPSRLPNYLIPAILATVFCCLPFGAVGIYFSAQVNARLAQGDFSGALKASRLAKMWSLLALLFGVIFVLLYFATIVLGLWNPVVNMGHP